MSEIENATNEMYHAMRTMARTGGYRERVELLQAVDKLSWFDNFGYAQYGARLDVVAAALERGVAEEDIPETLMETVENNLRLSKAHRSE
jgi:hypothetical protein